MATSLYQALDGLAVRAGGGTWHLHIEGMVRSQAGWFIRLVLIGAPSHSLTIRAARLDPAMAPAVTVRIQEWLADPKPGKADTIVIDDVEPDPAFFLAAATKPPAPAPHQKVLIVDDVADHLRLYEMTLADKYIVLRASSGHEALAIAEEQRPDIVLLDLMMPGLDGWSVCERLKANPATAATPVIIMTASAAPDVSMRARELGAAAVLRKPYVIEHLEQAIETTLARTPAHGAPRTRGSTSL